MAVNALGLVAVYLVGAIPIGVIVARLAGVPDIRRHGSGSIGATNVLRTAGRLPAALTLLGDVAKGYAAVRLAQVLGPESWWGALGAILAITGNCWSVFLRFKGGKGVATGLGAFLALAPWATGPAALVWLVIAATFRYVSLASMTATLCLPLGVAILGYPWSTALGALAAAGIIIWRHRDNLQRLLSGTERRLGERVPAP